MKRLLKLSLIIFGGAAVGLVVLLVFASLTGSPRREIITKAEYGDRWPLTVERGTVECVPAFSVIFHTGGVTYAVNGWAMTNTDYPDVREIWLDDPDADRAARGLKINIGPIIDRGLALCP